MAQATHLNIRSRMHTNHNFGTRVFRLFVFLILFSPFLFLLFFSFCCSSWPSPGLASSNIYLNCTSNLRVPKNITETGNSNQGVAKRSGRKFCSMFFSQIPMHFCAYFKLNPGIRMIFSWCKTCDAKFGKRWWCQKLNKGQCCHGQLWPTRYQWIKVIQN